MEELVKLEAAFTKRLIFIFGRTAGRPCRGRVLAAAVWAGGDGQRRGVKQGNEPGRGKREVALQLPLSQLVLQHHVLQLLVGEGPPLPHAGADGGAREVRLVVQRLLRPAGRVIGGRRRGFEPWTMGSKATFSC